jgi:hypothetical protein
MESQSFTMKFGPIAFMESKTVLRPLRIQLNHDLIPNTLCYDRGSTHTCALLIRPNNSKRGHMKAVRKVGPINDDNFWNDSQGRNGLVHGLKRRLQDIDLVDDSMVDHSNSILQSSTGR